MSISARQLYDELTKIIPTELSCPWDKDGFEVCPDFNIPIERVLVSLDVSDRVIEYAVKHGFDAIVAHHPLFFGDVGKLTGDGASGARAIKLIKNNISVMTFHTRLDANDGGVNDKLCELLELSDVETVVNGNEKIMRTGMLENSMTPEEFAVYVKEKLNAPYVLLSSCKRAVKKVALLGGSGSDDLTLAKSTGADAYLTGELKYHQTLMADELLMNIVCAGHFYTERPVCHVLKKTISDIAPGIYAEIYGFEDIMYF